MQRRVLEEQVHDQSAVDAGVYPVSGADDVVQSVLVGDDDQGSGLVLGHSSACLGQVVHLFACAHLGALPTGELVDYGPALSVVHVSVSKPYQELSDLRLEYHDDREHTDIQYHVHDRAHEPHSESSHDDTDHIQRYDCYENAHGRGAFEPSEYEKYYNAQQKDVEDVGNLYLQKIESSEQHIPIFIYPRKDSDKYIKF